MELKALVGLGGPWVLCLGPGDEGAWALVMRGLLASPHPWVSQVILLSPLEAEFLCQGQPGPACPDSTRAGGVAQKRPKCSRGQKGTCECVQALSSLSPPG